MINWREYPFVRLLLPLIGGILLSFAVDLPLPFYIFPAFFIGILLLTLPKGSYHYRFTYGLLVSVVFLLLGFHLTQEYDLSKKKDYFYPLVTNKTALIGTVLNKVQTAKSYRIALRIEAVDQTEQQVSGKLLTYMAHSERSGRLAYGDQIRFSSFINPIEPPKNPQAFDMNAYYFTQNFHHQTYLKDEQWQLVAHHQGYAIIAFAIRARDRLAAILSDHLNTPNELAVAAALILGKKDLLEADTKVAYANTGAMHVLAVSGLHVGLIYIGLSFLLGLIPIRSVTWVWIKTWVMVAGVWFFALLTGASPSVLRAATMFSFIITGRAMRHHPNIYNTLAASAFLLLCINPFMLFSVGFQLSYLAVTGIVYFQNKIYGLLYLPNRLGDKIWKLTSVAIAAQLVTLPISLYYFHQFPSYFWLSGLVVIPAAMLIMGLAILLFLVTIVMPEMAVVPGLLLYGTVYMTNGLIFLISDLPASIIDGIWLTPWTLLLLYIALGSAVLAINTQQFRWLKWTMGLLLVFSVSVAFRGITQHNSSHLVLYHTGNKKTMIDWVDRSTVWSVRGSDLSEKEEAFIAKNHRLSTGIQSVNPIKHATTESEYCWQYDEGLLQFKNISLQIIDGDTLPKYNTKRSVDYILLEQNTSVSLDSIGEYYDFKMLLLAANNTYKKNEKWMAAAKVKGYPVTNMKTSGAFLIDVYD